MDWPLSQSFEAPTLSDEDLAMEVQRQLRRSGYMSLRSVRTAVDCGCVRLHGRVPSYYLKQLAQTVALSIEGVEKVENNLIVE